MATRNAGAAGNSLPLTASFGGGAGGGGHNLPPLPGGGSGGSRGGGRGSPTSGGGGFRPIGSPTSPEGPDSFYSGGGGGGGGGAPGGGLLGGVFGDGESDGGVLEATLATVILGSLGPIQPGVPESPDETLAGFVG